MPRVQSRPKDATSARCGVRAQEGRFGWSRKGSKTLEEHEQAKRERDFRRGDVQRVQSVQRAQYNGGTIVVEKSCTTQS